MRDWHLLRQYAEEGSQAAFAELTTRYLSLVYTTCLREVREVTLAEDLTQIVFLLLARKAPGLREQTPLAGWLFQTARFTCRNALRRERRRKIAEQKIAAERQERFPPNPELWESLEPHLHRALTTLRPQEREVVLLRFFGERTVKETSIALGISEGAAQMRISRAVEKLRLYFSRHGIALSSAVLLSLLATRTCHAVPIACRVSVLKFASGTLAGELPPSTVASSLAQRAKGVSKAMWIHKIQAPVSLACVLMLGLAGHALIQAKHAAAEKTPIAPSVPIATLALSDDPRLNQKVRISAEGISLGEFLKLLAKKTGVSLEADSVTGDDKVVVFNPARPLRDLMEDLAVLFHDTWLHTKDGARHFYRLTRVVRAREYEDALATQTSRGLLAQLDEQVKALGESQAALSKRPQDDPVRRALENKEGRIATGVYALLSLQERAQLLYAWQARLPIPRLNETQKTDVEELFHGKRFEEINSHDANIVSGAFPPLEQLSRAQMEQSELTFRVLGGQGDNTFLSINMKGPQGFEMKLTDFRVSSRFLFPAHGSPYAAAKEPLESPFAVKDALDAAGDTWTDRLKALAQKTGLPVLADYYRSKAIFKAGEEAEEGLPPTVKAVDALCQPEGYLWWSRGKTLLFRKRDWYNQRLYETPDRLILKLSEQIRSRNGTLTAADALLFQELTLDQLVGLNESMGRPSDRASLAGLSEYLAAAAACPGNSNTPLYTGSIGKEVMPGDVAIKPDLSDPHQQALTNAFLQSFPRRIEAKDVIPGEFGYMILMSSKDPNVALDAKAVSVDLLLSVGDRGMTVGYQLALPLGLPDDRRDKTKIEVVR